jgi:hypothetical protein
MKEPVGMAFREKQNIGRIRNLALFSYDPAKGAGAHEQDVIAFARLLITDAIPRMPATEIGDECYVRIEKNLATLETHGMGGDPVK